MRGNRDSPRTSDLTLRDQEALLEMWRELKALRKDAVGFIGRIFHSHDYIWVERCSSIIQEEK